MSTTFPNPLIPGFNPDPSVVLVDGVYYLATSTFEYLPGLPIYRSTDFVTWEQIGNVAPRLEQLGIGDVITNGGVWAPTIRHRDGVFYVIVVVAMGRGCLLFETDDPSGPWSDGILIEGIDGIDPDLAWDADGTPIVTYSGLETTGPNAGRHTGIRQARVDLVAGRVLEEPRSIWSGTGGQFPEAPHLYEIDGRWYLMVAEGGTERGHGVSIARGDSPYGPFESGPGNPFLSARSTSRPVQNTGHGDLVLAPDGSWAIVLLGVRPRGGTRAFSALGRETFATTIEWVDGWPSAEPVALNPREQSLDRAISFAEVDELDAGWIAVRREPTSVASLTATPGALTISTPGSSMDDAHPAFVGRRQLTQNASFSTEVDVADGVGGISVRYDEEFHYDLEARRDAQGERILVTARAAVAGLRQEWVADVPVGPVRLELRSVAAPTGFEPGAMSSDLVHFIVTAGGESTTLAAVDGRYLSAETAASFTGRVAGLYAAEGTVRFADFVSTGDNG